MYFETYEQQNIMTVILALDLEYIQKNLMTAHDTKACLFVSNEENYPASMFFCHAQRD